MPKCLCRVDMFGNKCESCGNFDYPIIIYCPLHASTHGLLEAAQGLAIPFKIEHKTDAKKLKCSCLQFEDNDDCRHLALLEAIRVSTQKEGGVA